ncbi:class I SAM-dependent methyltransferase [Nakamurella sp. GG22]
MAWLARSTPKDLQFGWNHYWSSIRSTGVGGDVLWDSADLQEVAGYLPMMMEHFNTELPMVDVGCGNGSFTRHLADLFPRTVGIDLSLRAIELARRQSAGRSNLQYHQLDATVPGATTAIAAEIGPSNVFVRGVLHILNAADRLEFARNLLPLVGAQGRVLLAETNYRGSSLGYLASLGATVRDIPEPLERAIRDLPRPGHFGPGERRASFPDNSWTLLADGPTVIQTIPLRDGTGPSEIPGYAAVLAPRSD